MAQRCYAHPFNSSSSLRRRIYEKEKKKESLLTSLIYVYSPSSQTGSQRGSGSAKHKYIKNNEERDWISSTETHLSWRVEGGYFFR